MRIELSCDACGKNRFDFPETGGDDSIVICAECGHVVGTMGALKEAIAVAVMDKRGVSKVRKTLGIARG